MKKFNQLKMMLMVVILQLLAFPLMSQNQKVFVASDLHYFDPDLIINDGSALENYLMMDRKMIRESSAIVEAMVDTILSIHPDLVFFTGDLTKDGELTSHQKFAGYCQILEDAGIEVLVIPGNHDINNPHAFAYDGANVIPVPGVSPEEFASIYENFGFGQAIAKDPNSLTYIVEAAPGLQIFAMDVCKYDDNYTLGHPVTAGSIPADSYSWISGKLQEAKQNNKQVLGMIHHGLMEHYIGQKTLFSEYVIDGYDTLSVNFANMGMKAVFTGHYHAQDIVELTTADGNTIYDIETGSTVTYPCPFRTIEIENNNLVSITGGVITHINYDLGGLDFQTYAYNYLATGLPILVNYILTNPPYSLDPTSAGMITPVVTEAFIAHYQGNEGTPSPQSQAVINYLLSQPAYQMFGMMIMAIWNDPMPDDWNYTFNLKTISSEPGYVSGDFHQHSTYTDGSYSIGFVMQKNNQFGLDWWANSEHGGGFNRDAAVSGLDLSTTVYWDSYAPSPIIGTVSNSGGHQNMWRWQSLRDYSFDNILSARSTYSDRMIFQSYELNVPGHEHASMGLINNQFDASPNCNPLAEFEFKFDASDSDVIGGVSQGWTKSTLSGHAKAIEAISWLQTNYPSTSYVIAAHPERKSLNNIQGFRDMNNAGPDVCFGFESMPGHQKASDRGEYKTSYNTAGTTTYGGCGIYAGKVGGLWDSMLSEGRHWWLFASSDFHSTDADFYPGEYQKTYTYVSNKSNPQSYIDGLRSGNSFVVTGDLIDSLDFRIGESTLFPVYACMGETFSTTQGSVVVKILVNDPQDNNNNTYSAFTNPAVDHIDLIMGKVSGKVAPGSPDYTVDNVATTKVIARFDAVGGVVSIDGIVSQAWTDLGGGLKEILYTYNGLVDSVYFRLRGTNLGLNVANETDANGNPLSDALMAPNNATKAFADLWFYSNPIFVDGPASYAKQLEPRTIYSSTSGDIYKGGFGSGMFPMPGQDDTYYMITDRGPNADGPTPDVKIFPVPDFTPQVGIFKRVGSDLVLQDSILLKREDGTLLTGLPNPVGMGSTGETALDLDGNVLGTDPDGLDSESIVVCADGSFWVSDEYGPHIVHFDANGNTIERINPFGTGTGGRTLPAVFAKRRANRGMEGLAITPDGKTLVGIMQSTMYNPTSTIAGKNVTRILSFDIETGVTKQFIYLQEANALSNCEIAAIDNNTFLVVERDGLFPGDATPAVYKRIYKIYTDGATDVSDPENGEFGLMFQNGTKTIEQLTAAQLLAEGIVPVRKVLVADLLVDVPGYPHDKFEGVGIINDNLIAICNDDDFGISPDGNNGYTTKILPATGQVDFTSNYLIGLSESLSAGYKGGNTAPVASLDIPDQSLSTGDVVVLNLSDYFTDAEGNHLAYSAKLPNGTMVPEWIKYDQFAKTLTLCPAYPATLTVEVTATDLIDKTSQEFDINVVVANPMLTYLSGIKLGSWGEGAAEISAYDAGTKKLFVTNAEFTTLDILDLNDPSNPAKVDDVDITTYGAGLQSVAVYNGVVAVAVQPEASTDPGFVVFFDTDGNFLSQVTVGSLPDMLAFTHDGTKLLVANEGEPNADYTIDPEGSVSIIDMTVGAANLTNANVVNAGFTAFNGATLDAGIRIFGPGATVAQDIEPEYITISPDGTKAYITCQENNAFAVVDIATATVTDLLGMGFKNHNLPGNGMDASDKSGAVQIKSWPVFGMYLPDAVDSYSVNGKTYFVTVNEGDARDYDGYSEEARVKDLSLDPVAFPDASWLKKNENLGRLKTTKANGDIDNDGDFDEIYCFGGRSFTIWDENGNVVFDSQDDLEQITAGYLANNFNASHEGNNSFKDRSDDKGPEPEALKVAQIDGRYYAFIGLERVGGIMVYDVTNPNFPEFVEYRNDRNFAVDAEDDLTGHYGPEGIIFIKASESGNGQPLVVVSHEISGSVAIYQVNAANAVLPQMLTVLHNNDAESQLIESSYGAAYGGVANFKFKADSLRSQAFSKMSPAIMLSSGDNYLAGPEFSASLNLPAGQPYYDAVAMDHIGFDAVCMGNHDFDFGPDVLEKFIHDYSITQPTYLSANLDFSNEPGLQDLVNTGRINKSTVVNLNGTYVGVVGLTTPKLDYISSPRNVIVNDDLVNIAQEQIDSLINLGLNKIILISHLQSIKEDSALISQLRHVDIAIAGGGSELLTNDPSIALPGMDIYGNYPLEYDDADGETVYVVTTPGEYTYVGHLMAEFDIDGNVISIDPASNPVLVTKTTPDAELKELVEEPVSEYVANLAQNIIATTQVTLDGVRNNIRTLETNEGDLVADATFWQATQLAPAFGVNLPDVAFQNGGGIRNNAFISAGSNITELTTFDILPFANFVAIIENVSPSQFKEVLENAVSRVEFVDGRFAQIAGFEFTWDPAGTRQIITDGLVTTPGTRVIEAKLANGTMIIANGSVVPGAPAINIATLDFLAKGGDQYPLTNLDFTTLGVTYQQALYNYLTSSKAAVITAADYPEGGNARILNLNQQNVNTPKGWSIISGYIEPDNNVIKEVVKKIATSGNLEIMISRDGFYWPSQNINTFTDGWSSQSGYKIKMNAGDNFILKGVRTENKVIDLVKGVNYLPVPSTQPVAADAVFSQIANQLIFAFDIESGSVYWPEGGLFTLSQLVPGNGYIVSLNAPASVDFSGFKSSPLQENVNLYQQISTSPFKTELTGNYHLIAILNETMSDFEQGDVITIFKDNNTFAGQVLVEKNGKNTCILAVGDDATTETTEGFLNGETMNFKLYRSSTEEIFDLNPEFSNTLPNTGLFAENGASMIVKFQATSVNTITAAEGFSVYPNPNTGTFNVMVKGFDETIKLEVFNAQGQLILQNSMNSQIHGVECKIDLSTSPKGIYFVKANSRSNNWSQKVIIK